MAYDLAVLEDDCTRLQIDIAALKSQATLAHAWFQAAFSDERTR